MFTKFATIHANSASAPRNFGTLHHVQISRRRQVGIALNRYRNWGLRGHNERIVVPECPPVAGLKRGEWGVGRKQVGPVEGAGGGRLPTAILQATSHLLNTVGME